MRAGGITLGQVRHHADLAQPLKLQPRVIHRIGSEGVGHVVGVVDPVLSIQTGCVLCKKKRQNTQKLDTKLREPKVEDISHVRGDVWRDTVPQQVVRYHDVARPRDDLRRRSHLDLSNLRTD